MTRRSSTLRSSRGASECLYELSAGLAIELLPLDGPIPEFDREAFNLCVIGTEIVCGAPVVQTGMPELSDIEADHQQDTTATVATKEDVDVVIPLSPD